MLGQVRLEIPLSGHGAQASDDQEGYEHENSAEQVQLSNNDPGSRANSRVDQQRTPTETADDEETTNDTENLDAVDNDLS